MPFRWYLNLEQESNIISHPFSSTDASLEVSIPKMINMAFSFPLKMYQLSFLYLHKRCLNDIADPSSTQDTRHMNLVNTRAHTCRSHVSCSLVVKAFDWYAEGHGYNSYKRLRTFLATPVKTEFTTFSSL